MQKNWAEIMRARNIKPGFFDNDVLAEGGPAAQVLFCGLWCLADKRGILENRPKKIKAKIFPYYPPEKFGNKNFDQLLSFLFEKKFILLYSAEGLELILIRNFLKHQSPHHTEKASNLPLPEDIESITDNSPLLDGKNPPDSLIPDSLIPDSLIPDSCEEDEKKVKRNSIPYVEIVEIYNKNKPEQLPIAQKLTNKRKEYIRDSWKEHQDLGWFIEYFKMVSLSSFHLGQNDRGWIADIDYLLRPNKREEFYEKLCNMKSRESPTIQKPDQNCQICGGKGLINATTDRNGKIEKIGVKICECVNYKKE